MNRKERRRRAKLDRENAHAATNLKNLKPGHALSTEEKERAVGWAGKKISDIIDEKDRLTGPSPANLGAFDPNATLQRTTSPTREADWAAHQKEPKHRLSVKMGRGGIVGGGGPDAPPAQSKKPRNRRERRLRAREEAARAKGGNVQITPSAPAGNPLSREQRETTMDILRRQRIEGVLGKENVHDNPDGTISGTITSKVWDALSEDVKKRLWAETLGPNSKIKVTIEGAERPSPTPNLDALLKPGQVHLIDQPGLLASKMAKAAVQRQDLKTTHERIVATYLDFMKMAITQDCQGYAPVARDDGTVERLRSPHFQMAVGHLGMAVRQCRIFEFSDLDYLNFYHHADRYTSEVLAGVKWSPYDPEHEATEEELDAWRKGVYPATQRLPLPDHLPFEYLYLAWGTGALLSPSQTFALIRQWMEGSDYGEVPVISRPLEVRLLLATVVTREGYVFGILEHRSVKNQKLTDRARENIRRRITEEWKRDPEYRKGFKDLEDALVRELAGKDDVSLADTEIEMVVERTPDEGWLNGTYLTPWIVQSAIAAVNACETLQAERTLLSTKLRLKEFSKRSGSKFLPPPYYVVYVAPHTMPQKPQMSLPQPREWSHQWDVMGHWYTKFARGNLPLSDADYHKFTTRGYVIYHALHPLDANAIGYLTKKQLPPIRSHEWMALKRTWKKDFVKGPPDKPYVPSNRKLRGGVPITVTSTKLAASP